MLIKSMIIKVTKGGVGIGPDYSLTIHGSGKVIYDGVENVKHKGLAKKTLENEKIISLLSDFKDTGFFSLKDNYTVEDSASRPYTIISISIPKENGEILTKRIKFHHGDKNVPKELKELENKIDAIVNSKQWVGDLSDYEGFKPKKEDEQSNKSKIEKKPIKPKKPTRKKPFKLIGVVIVCVIVIFIILLSQFTDIFNLASEEQDNDNNGGQIIEETIPEIIDLNTASSVDLITGDFTSEVIFYQGENISVILEYKNISTINNESCDLYLEIDVEHNGTPYHKPEGINRTFIGKCIQIWWFVATDEWVPGIYYVNAYLTDNISNTTISESKVFTVLENI